ncbi:MAG: hypothetical protein GY941_23650 [Planctomycetes bacterium]|nr:hypothetical protein [Planctomycetota bacterium]
MKHIKYIKKKTKYRLEVLEYIAMVGIIGYTAETPLIKLTPIGKLTVRYGYGFDPSGPTIDTKSAMRASLEHDALCELMRLGFVPLSELDAVNDRLEIVCKEDGMMDFRAEAWDAALDVFGESSADPKYAPKIRTAP